MMNESYRVVGCLEETRPYVHYMYSGVGILYLVCHLYATHFPANYNELTPRSLFCEDNVCLLPCVNRAEKQYIYMHIKFFKICTEYAKLKYVLP